MLWPKVLEADCAEEHSVIGTFGRRAGEKFVKSHGEGGLFGHLNSQLWGLICVYGETEQPLAQQLVGLHGVGCALESFQFFSFEQFHLF